MRALIPGLDTPHPLGLAMPALYQDDDFTQRFLSAFDEVLAPVFSVLDNLEAYFDPSLAPDDFVAWLGEWVGVAVDENWDPERRRRLVAEAAELYRWRGTRKGLADHITLYAGFTPEILESGGSSWSASPGSAPVGEATFSVTIRVDEADGVDLGRLERIVRAAKPAHISHTIEVVSTNKKS